MPAPSVTTLIFEDLFSGTDGAAVTSRSPNLGSNWAAVSGYAGVVRIRTGGVARAEASSGQSSEYAGIRAPVSIPSNTYRIETLINIPATFSTVTTPFVWISLEDAADSWNPFYLEFVCENYGSNVVRAKLFGPGPAYDSVTENAAGSPGGTVKLEVVVESGLTAWLIVNDVEVGSISLGSPGAEPTGLGFYPRSATTYATTPTVDYIRVYTAEASRIATGFQSTTFGAPTSPVPRTETATGFNPANFGTPVSVATPPPTATGFQPTRFGRPEVPVPGYITDVATGQSLLPEFITIDPTPHTSALGAYATWKTQIGAGADQPQGYTSLGSFSVSGFPEPLLLNSSVTYLQLGAEGTVALYRAAPSSFVDGARTLTPFSPSYLQALAPFYGTLGVPSLLLSFKPPTDDYELAYTGETGEAVKAVSASAGVMYARWRRESGSGPSISAAFKFKDQSIEIVVEVDSTAGNSPYFQVARLRQGDSAYTMYAGDGTFSEELALSSVTHYSTGAPAQEEFASGWQPTQFGAAVVQGLATGTLITQFGVPEGINGWRAQSFGPLIQMGAVYHPFDQSPITAGWTAGKYGVHAALAVRTAPFGEAVDAIGNEVTAFGVPLAGYYQEAATSGSSTTTFGTPRGKEVQIAASFGVVAFGLPSGSLLHVATGALFTSFGAAAAAHSNNASSIPRQVRFGAPRSYASGHFARGWRAFRGFGRPAGASMFYYPAQGDSTTAFGTPQASPALYARHIAPSTRFGVPLLERPAAC